VTDKAPRRCGARAVGSPRVEASASPAPPRVRRFLVPIQVEIEVDQRLIDDVLTSAWRTDHYPLHFAGDVAAHLAYNLVQGSQLPGLDGFADQPTDRARVVTIRCDESDVEDLDYSACSTMAATRPGGALTPAMVLLLSIVEGGAQVQPSTRSTGTYWASSGKPERVVLPDGSRVEHTVFGASDACTLRALDRRGLIRKATAGGADGSYGAYAITEAGRAWLESARSEARKPR
jgi:hypothetical protein